MSAALLRDVVLPAAFNKDDTEFLECKLNTEAEGKDQFQSNIVFLTATVKVKTKKVKLPLVVKFEPFNLELRKFFRTYVQFRNEVFMYSRGLPFLDRLNIVGDTFGRYYHGVGVVEETDSNVVVLEDLTPSGYKMTQSRGYMDFDHLALAMTKLGRFHSLSFAAKTTPGDEFFRVAHTLQEVLWVDEFTFLPVMRDFYHRAIDPLIRRGKHVQLLQRLLDVIEETPLKYAEVLHKAKEPSAVVCHGDFCRNNMLFKYGDDGRPVDVKFIDLGTSRYFSLAGDVTLLLFLSCSSEVRRQHWDDLLAIYHSSLSNTIPGTEVPSLDDVKKEVLRKAMHAFNVCSFFLPMMLFDLPFDSIDFVVTTPVMEAVEVLTSIGGEAGTEVLSDMILELIDRGCLTMDHDFMLPIS